MDANQESNDEVYVVGDVPDELHAEDAIAHKQLQRTIAYDDHIDAANMIQAFARSERKDVKLSTLENEYNAQLTSRALGRLVRRQRVTIDKRYIHDVADANLAWAANEHFIDLIVIVTDKIGLHAIIPQTDADPSYVFKLDLHQRHRTWKSKHGDLGFDTAGRMLYIGTYHQEEIWVAMAPRTFTRGESATGTTDIESSSSTLSQEHFCMLVTMLAQQLHAGGYKDIQIREGYPEKLTQKDMRAYTNIFGHGLTDREVHEMTLREVKTFHGLIVSQYASFIRNAPKEWLDDNYLRDNVPITIAVRYGQNQEVCRPDHFEEEADHWNRLHRYKHVRTVTVALATHIQCVPVGRWEVNDVGKIMAENIEGVYDSRVLDERSLVDLRRYPLLDDAGHERNIYDRNGHRIPRRHAILDDGVSTAGMLFKLRNLHELFEDRLFDGGGDSDIGSSKTEHFAYPIACLANIGQFQAHGVMHAFIPLIHNINQSLTMEDEDSDDDIDMDGAAADHLRRIIVPISSQGYNAYVHRVRAKSRFHDVQKGMITAAFLGTHVTGQALLNRARDLKELCQIGLPFDRYHGKIVGAEFDQSLRLENVYTIQVAKMRRGDRNGRFIFKNIIYPLSRTTSHPSILEDIKRHVVIFKQDVLPSIVEWTTYGICTALRSLWDMHESNLETGLSIPHYYVELTSALERALNFSHTGNPKVLSRGVMDPLWLSLSCVADGMPCLSPLVYTSSTENEMLRVRRSDWPVSTRTAYPEVCTKRSLVLNYGVPQFNAYHAIFHIKHSVGRLPSTFEDHIADRSVRQALYVLSLAFQVYESDVRMLVSSSVAASLADFDPDSEADGPQAAVRLQRTQALEAWLKLKEGIMGYQNRAHTNLVLAVVTEPDFLTDGLPSSVHSPKSAEWFAEQILSVIRLGGTSTRAPFITGGGALAIMRIAVDEAKLHMGVKDDGQILQLIVRAMNILYIMYVPWSRDPSSQRGRPPITVVHDSWITLGTPHRTKDRQSVVIAGPSQKRAADAKHSSSVAAESNCRAPWSVTDVSVQDLHLVLNWTTLPTEWSLKSLFPHGDKSYVSETYTWVRNNYDGTKSLHQTAIIVAIFFAAAIPNVLHEPLPEHLRDGGFGDSITNAVRSSAWCAPPSDRKGFKLPNQFITMMSTFIIALYEPNSPLRKYMNDNGNKLGAPWTSKHGAKGIKPFNLVRMGLANAHCTKIYTSPLYGASWSLLHDSDIEDYHTRLVRHLRDQPYGPYSALVFVFGENKAKSIAKDNKVKGRGLTRKADGMSGGVGSSKKRRMV
ncbi:hypothetical protein F5141DRAFT_1135721 [Pisolithus sp. B1]|nr:hypothetical protein F5141DRAFT_1135721 [Pisolithus sp. B1]